MKVTALTMHTESADSTVHISTTLFTGTAGIMIRFITIPSITPHGIIHHTDGAWDGTGIHHTTAGIPRITAHGTVHITPMPGAIRIPTTVMVSAGVIRAITGMVTHGITTVKIIVTGREDPPAQVFYPEPKEAAELLPQQSVHLPAQQPVLGKILQFRPAAQTAGEAPQQG